MLINETSVSALTEALERYMPEVVGALAKEYGFDEEEGLKMLGELRVQKEGKSRGVKAKRVVPKIIVPFCGVVQDDWCKAVRYNRGLFTQCTNACKKDSKFCTTCLKYVSTDGIPQYGLIEERGNEGWTDPNGKVPVNYGNILSKIDDVTKEQAIAEAEKLGWTIPEEQFEVVKTRKGRPAKKSKETTDEKPKKRGRPKKSKPVVDGAGTGDDLIAQLVQQAQLQNEVVAADEQAEDEASVDGSDPTLSPAEQAEDEASVDGSDPTLSPAEQAEDKAVSKQPKKTTRKKKTAEEKEADKLAKAEAKAKLAAEKKANAEAKKKANAEAKKLAKAEAKKLAEAEAKKLAEAEAKKLAEAEKLPNANTYEELEEEEEEEEEEDSVQVIKFTHEGVEYLRDADGTIYDMVSQEEIGAWDDESKTLNLI